MNIFSAQYLNQTLSGVVRRFSLVLLSIIVTVIAVIIFLENTTSIENQGVNVAMACSLSVVAFLNSKLYKERYNIAQIHYYIINVGILSLLLLYYYFLPDDINNHLSENIRFAGIMLSLHLVASYLPYLKSNNLKAFTGYNFQVLLRFLESFLFIWVLFGTISLAIVAVEHLFEVDIMTSKRYTELFVIITGLVGGLYFLSNYPKDFEEGKLIKYNKAFGVFSRFILIPIVIIYAFILYAYAVKLIMIQAWPEKWMITMSNWFFALGILAYLFNYVNNYQNKNRVATLYLKWFFPVTLPLTLSLLLPIYKKFFDEGITEENYTLATIALWVIVVSIYYITSKKHNIKILPISLSMVIILSVFGPWSMSKLSLRSQWVRLENKMIEVGVLDVQNGLKSVDDKISHDDYVVIYQSLQYISKRGQLNRFMVWDKQNILSKETQQRASFYEILVDLGLKYGSPRQRRFKNDNQYFSFSGNRTYDVKLDSFMYFLPIISNVSLTTPSKYLLFDEDANKMILILEEEHSYFDLPEISQLDTIYRSNDNMVPNELWIKNKTYSVLIKFHYIRGRKGPNGRLIIEHFEGNAFVKLDNNN